MKENLGFHEHTSSGSWTPGLSRARYHGSPPTHTGFCARMQGLGFRLESSGRRRNAATARNAITRDLVYCFRACARWLDFPATRVQCTGRPCRAPCRSASRSRLGLPCSASNDPTPSCWATLDAGYKAARKETWRKEARGGLERHRSDTRRGYPVSCGEPRRSRSRNPPSAGARNPRRRRDLRTSRGSGRGVSCPTATPRSCAGR
jgi:hypothetical protein